MIERNRLQRAEKWLATGDDTDLPYACLELRMCLESLVYAKLEFYKKYVPGVVFDKWQLAHAMKMLLQFEPYADSDQRIAFAPESSPGVACGPFQSLGEHKFFPTKKLSKDYNLLGSFLHVPQSGSPIKNLEKLRANIQQIADKIKDVLNSSILNCTFAKRMHLNCQLCNTKCLSNAEVVRKTKRALCINQNCGAEYYIENVDQDGDIQLLQADFKCVSCGTSNYFAYKSIEVGMTFSCNKCKAEHIVVSKQWSFDLKKNLSKL